MVTIIMELHLKHYYHIKIWYIKANGIKIWFKIHQNISQNIQNNKYKILEILLLLVKVF